jgi:hypothetical protein
MNALQDGSSIDRVKTGIIMDNGKNASHQSILQIPSISPFFPFFLSGTGI